MSGQFDDTASYQTLQDRLERIDAAHGTQGNRIFYLATPPELFPTITGRLGDAGLHKPKRRAIVRATGDREALRHDSSRRAS